MAHPVTDALAGVTDPTQRQAIKVAAIVALPNVVNTVTVGAYTVTLVARPVAAVNGCLQFNVKITKGGVDVTPPLTNPVRVWFGGLMPWVPDPAGDIVTTSTDPETQVVTTTKFREDLHAMLLQIASNCVAGLP
jgi:hypothetical protein